MIETKKPKMKAQDRAKKGLFFNLQNAYGSKYPSYHQAIRHPYLPCNPCLIQQLDIDGKSQWIGMLCSPTEHLVTVYFFTQRPEKSDDLNDIVSVQIEAGKICPESEQAFYPERVILRWRRDLVDSIGISLVMIQTLLGEVTAFDPFNEDQNKLFMSYELSFDVPKMELSKKTYSVAY